MPYVLFGAGLIGGYLGAAGGITAVVTRRPSPSGWRVALPGGTVQWRPEPLSRLAADRPTLVATRRDQTPTAGLPARCLLAQNGLEHDGPVAVCFMAIDRRPDGTLVSSGVVPRMVVGPLDPIWEPLLQAWSAAGIAVQRVADARPAQWEKNILNATVGPLCRATGLGMEAVWADPDLRRLTLGATREGIAIAQAAGIALDDGALARAERFFDQVGDHLPSAVRDAGELPYILTPLLRTAARVGLSAPCLQRIAGRVGMADHAA
jgi:hypothetical protein